MLGPDDAANLAWKLAAIVREGASEDLLDTYQTERARNLRATIDMAVMMGRTVCITDPAAAAARDAQMLAARAAGHSPDGTVDYPPMADGLILAGSAGAGSYFPQPVAGEARLDDVLDAGHWLIDRASLDRSDLEPFRAALAGWLDTQGAEAVLVRPDRYVFGTGSAGQLAESWEAALKA